MKLSARLPGCYSRTCSGYAHVGVENQAQNRAPANDFGNTRVRLPIHKITFHPSSRRYGLSCARKTFLIFFFFFAKNHHRKTIIKYYELYTVSRLQWPCSHLNNESSSLQFKMTLTFSFVSPGGGEIIIADKDAWVSEMCCAACNVCSFFEFDCPR